MIMNKFYSPDDLRIAILQYRKENDLNKTQFCALTWVAQQTITQINNGKLSYIMTVTLDKLKKHNVIS